MVNKSLMLAMIIFFVNAAQGGIVELSITPNYVSYPGDVVKILVHSNSPFAGGAINFKITVSKSIEGTCRILGNWLFKPSPIEVITVGDAQIFSFGTGTIGLPAPAGDWLELAFKIPNEIYYGEFLSITSSGTFFGESPSASITLVPEPMTFGLLGLGGLLLRKKEFLC